MIGPDPFAQIEFRLPPYDKLYMHIFTPAQLAYLEEQNIKDPDWVKIKRKANDPDSPFPWESILQLKDDAGEKQLFLVSSRILDINSRSKLKLVDDLQTGKTVVLKIGATHKELEILSVVDQLIAKGARISFINDHGDYIPPREMHNYAIMPYYSGECLYDQMKTIKKLPLNKRLCLAYKIYANLKQLHNLGIYHGDLNYGNIMISSNNNVRIIDFGFSHYFEDQKISEDCVNEDLYRLNIIFKDMLPELYNLPSIKNTTPSLNGDFKETDVEKLKEANKIVLKNHHQQRDFKIAFSAACLATPMAFYYLQRSKKTVNFKPLIFSARFEQLNAARYLKKIPIRPMMVGVSVLAAGKFFQWSQNKISNNLIKRETKGTSVSDRP